MIQFRAVKVALAGAVTGVLTLTACTGDGAGPSGGDTNIVQGTGEITHVPPEERQDVPDLSGETVDGDQLALSDYRGQVVVLNVWGSWCAPCIAEADDLVRVAEATADQGVQFVGINARDPSRANAVAFEDNHGVTYPSLYDPDGRLLLEFPRGSLNPQTIPSTLIIDPEGRIAARALTALSEEALTEALAPVLAEG
ncbi:TlpA family protein disulfide reductase [Streptomyces johnsoniae]|uniref:TlpA disulfide reductase family protein n=1 Tax=Streptomyces johnsoniae TaxID=3075532 RepID=A0ABU2RZH7_9ACTN|nr:TlpA disulfide reductase family protein [Streptomyces sp. DSM 41886]MDT0442120.1 TlpA disulfide reductase family protein [Streptomyces sp. DSM 41886]